MPVAADDVNVIVPPHCVTGPAGVTVGVAGNGLTVTVAFPDRSADIELHNEPFNVAIVYVVVDDGVTATVIGLVVPVNGIAPGDNVPLHGPAPVTAMLRLVVVDCPLQYDVLPLITAVGRWLTVITEVPVFVHPAVLVAVAV